MSHSLPPNPSLSQLKIQARELRKAHRSGDPDALARVDRFLDDSAARADKDQENPLSLQNAQFVVAREYGFSSWPRLVSHIESLTGQARRPGEVHEMKLLRQRYGQRFIPSGEQIGAMLEKHGLGRLRTQHSFEANIINSLLRLHLEGGERLILKIQFCPVGGWDLEREDYVIRLLRRATDLPVADLCLLNNSREVIPHPYLLCRQLPGEDGSRFFENTDPKSRIELATMLGRIVGTMHGIEDVDPMHLGHLGLHRWRTVVDDALSSDGALRQEIAALADGFFDRLDALVEKVDLAVFEERQVLVWPEVAFHNLLVEERNGEIQVTGIFDFQCATCGSPLLSYVRGEENFKRTPAEIYDRPEHVEAFYRGYEEVGGRIVEYEAWHRTLLEVIRHALQVRYWWDCMAFLHPKNPRWLQQVLAGLEELTRL